MLYRAHMKNVGWGDWKQLFQQAGTCNETLECMELQLDDIPNLGVSVSAHISNVGWDSPKVSNELIGRLGEQIEAIKVELYGSEAPNYDIWYHVYINGQGWTKWVKNGEPSGTEGGGLALGAFNIALCKKGAMLLTTENDITFLKIERQVEPVVTPPSPAEEYDEETLRAMVVERAQYWCDEVGYIADYDGHSIFGDNLGMPYAQWCHCFVTTCFDEAGLGDLVPRTALCPDGVDWFLNHPSAYFYSRGEYVPEAGDVIYFDWDDNEAANHVGLVEGCDGYTVCTIEGNTGDPIGVWRKYWDINDGYIVGYGVPDYSLA